MIIRVLRFLQILLLGSILISIAICCLTDNKPVWKPDSSSEFEVGTQLRAWTIRDEGISYILDNVQSMGAINNIYFLAVMHQEHRPFQAPEFPHNPARDYFDAEDARITFFPDLSRYGTIKPLRSDYDWIRDTDWLQLVVDSCRARGLGVGAEVSHFPIPKELVRANPDWQQKKIDGEVWDPVRFCPNNPDTREYLVALFGDLAANYDLDYIQTCQHLFNNLDIDEGGTCFCRYCIDAADKKGFDLETAIPVLQEDMNSQPERDNWLKFRRNSTTEIYQMISAKIREENPRCHLRYNDTYPFAGNDTRDYGMYIEDVSPYLGSVVNQDHQEQRGMENEDFSRRKEWLERNRSFIGDEKPLISGIAPRMKASPDLVRRGVVVAVEHPARINGLALKHYDGASFGLIRAFKQGMIDAGVRGLTPTIGMEVEEMELDNYSVFTEELVEEFGVETNGRATASSIFPHTSGRYDIRITYFDEDDGQSPVKLLVADKEVASFTLDEDVDCWRWRMFKDIRVKKGDWITLVGEKNQGEHARLDYIEFIPRNNR